MYSRSVKFNGITSPSQADRQHYVRSAVVFKCLTCSTFDDVTDDVILPLGGVGQIFLGENQSRIYPNVCQIWLRSGGRVEKKGGGVQTDRQTKGHCSFI